MNMLEANEYVNNDFYKWLSTKFSSRQISIFVSVVSFINNHYCQIGYLKESIFETSDISILKKMQADLLGGKAFREKYPSRAMNAYLLLSYYIQYLESTMSFSNDKNSPLKDNIKSYDIEKTNLKTVTEQFPIENIKAPLEDIKYSDLTAIILNNGFTKYEPKRLRYYDAQYKVNGWNDLYTRTIQLLKRDYPSQMSGIKVRLYGTFSDKTIVQLKGYLKRCWISDQDYEVGYILNDDFYKKENHTCLKKNANTQGESDKVVTVPDIMETTEQRPSEWSLLEFLDSKKIKYVDKTQKGGCVWIIGGYELAPIVDECAKHGISFRYSERGGLASGKKPAWWVRLKKIEIQDAMLQERQTVKCMSLIDEHQNSANSISEVRPEQINEEYLSTDCAPDVIIKNQTNEDESNSSSDTVLFQEQKTDERLKLDNPKYNGIINSENMQHKDDSEDDSKTEACCEEKKEWKKSYSLDRKTLVDEEQKTFEEIFGVIKENYSNDSIENLNLSARSSNVLHRKKIFTVKDFLMITPSELSSSKNLGKKSFNEIVNCLEEYCTIYKKINKEYVNSSMQETEAKLHEYMEDVLAYRWNVLDTSFANDQVVTNELQRLKLIDVQLLEACKIQPNMVECLTDALTSFYEKYLPDDLQLYTIESLTKLIPQERFGQLISGYIFAYTDDIDIESCLKKLFISQNMTVREYFNGIKKRRYSEAEFQTISAFVQWLSFDIYRDSNTIIENMHLSDREELVVSLRSKGKTLDQIGKQICVTRERVRQIESKVRRRFVKQLRCTNVIKKLYAVRNENVVLTPADCREYFGKNADVILHLLRITEFKDYVYDAEYDVFVIAKTTIKDSIREFMETVPEMFSEEELVSIENRAIEEYGLTVDLIQRAISDRYTKSGQFYSTSRITLKTIYNEVLRKFYPSGIHVYDKSELMGFRKHVYDLYGEVDLPDNDRALTAGLCRDGMTILCGRGKYKLAQKKYIPDALAKKIKKYIDHSKHNVFLMNTIFYEFQDELVDAGVDNKYYLQGILKSLYGDIYYFRRDYLMKDDEDTSIHGLIQDYIKKSKYPVSKEDIMRKFPGVTDIVIAMALSDKSIIRLWGRYMNASNLQFSPKEMKSIDAVMQKKVFQRDGYAYGKDLYAEINKKIPYALSRNSINQPYELLSVLGYLYSKKCIVSRPYIALKGVEIGKASERMDEFINNDSVVSISAITEYAKKIHMTIYSILPFLERYFDNYLLINNKQVASYEYIGIDCDLMEKVDQILQTEVSETIAIRELMCINELPSLNVNWNEWLIYSIVKTISQRLDVATSDSQMKHSIPLISPKGEMNINYDVSNMDKNHQGDLQSEQGIDNLDDMLEEFIEELFDDIDFDN